MSARNDGLEDLRIGDLMTFLAVRRTGSITAAARELRVTPSQVSKAIARLEDHLQMRLLARSSRGVSLSESGRKIVGNVEAAVEKLRTMRRPSPQGGLELTVAAPSYLNSLFVPMIAQQIPAIRVRCLEMPPALVRAYAADNIFDVAILPSGADRLPLSWTVEALGELRKMLFAPPALARKLGHMPVNVDALRDVPWVCPISSSDGRFVAIDDDCPLETSQRRIGHEAQTIVLALELAARTEQLVFGPVVAARKLVEQGRLVPIRVQGWDVREPLHVACSSDRVLSRVQTAIAAAVRATLDELDPPAPAPTGTGHETARSP